MGYEPEIQVVWFDKFINRDLAFFHQPTKTLVQADLLFNLPGYEQVGIIKYNCYSDNI